MTRHSAAARRRPVTPDGTPTACSKRCGKQVVWFDTQYSMPGDRKRVCLDVDPVADPTSRLARYRIDYSGLVPIAVTVRQNSYLPDHPEEPRFSAHFDTCQASNP